MLDPSMSMSCRIRNSLRTGTSSGLTFATAAKGQNRLLPPVLSDNLEYLLIETPLKKEVVFGRGVPPDSCLNLDRPHLFTILLAAFWRHSQPRDHISHVGNGCRHSNDAQAGKMRAVHLRQARKSLQAADDPRFQHWPAVFTQEVHLVNEKQAHIRYEVQLASVKSSAAERVQFLSAHEVASQTMPWLKCTAFHKAATLPQ